MPRKKSSKPKTAEEWNNQSASYFCGNTHDLSLAKNIEMTLLDFPFWAYIYHEPDKDSSTRHMHFMLQVNGTRKVYQIANKLGIEPNFVQPMKSYVGHMRYFMHLDDKDKIQYKVSDVHTNKHFLFRQAEKGEFESDIMDLYNSYLAVKRHEITGDMFIKLNYIEISKLGFYQKIKILDLITNVSECNIT